AALSVVFPSNTPCHFVQDAVYELVYHTVTLKQQPVTQIKGSDTMQKITTFLWFDDQAEEAINFYTSIFPDSRIVSTTRYPEGAPGPAGKLMSATFELHGQQFM